MERTGSRAKVKVEFRAGSVKAFDASGNTLSDPSGKPYSWDFENRLLSAIVPSTGTVAFRYDPFGRRIQKSSTSGTTNYLYDGVTIVEEVDGSGNVLARYTQGKRVDEPLAELRQGTTSYYEQDGLGSITSLSNSAGGIAETYTYDNYGNMSASSGALVNPFHYTGREFDSETDIYYYRARYFNPSTGRFLSQDPIRYGGGVNFYAYTRNNPVVRIDPTGYQGCNAAQWAQSPNACAGPQDPNAPYQGPDGQWFNVPEWTPPPPDPPLPDSLPSAPTLPLPSPSCDCDSNRTESPMGQFKELLEVDDAFESWFARRVIFPAAMISTGAIVAGAGAIGTVELCSTGLGCVLAPVTGGVTIAGGGLALEGVYYAIYGEFFLPSGAGCRR